MTEAIQTPPPRLPAAGGTGPRGGGGPGKDRMTGSGSLGRFTPLLGLSLLIAGLFAVPIVSVIGSIFAEGQGTWAHLAETVLPRYLWNTVWLVLGVGLGVSVIGVTTAWLITMCRFPGRRIFEWAMILPLAVPAYVMAYAYTDFLQFSGPLQSLLRELTGWTREDYWFPSVRSLGGSITMLSLVLYPYVYLLARTAFLEQSVCALEVSRTLGCSAWGSFFRIALPLARPAIAAGTTLALMETLADYGTVAFFGVQTFTTGIVRAWISFGDRIAAAQLATSLLGFVFLVLLLERWSRGRARYHHTSSRYQKLPGYKLRGLRAGLAALACGLPLLLGFLLPAGILLDLLLQVEGPLFGRRFLDLVQNSFTLAALTAVLAVVLAVIMTYAVRLSPGALGAFAIRFASLGYAIPGIVIAIGILIPFATLDNAIDAWMRRSFGVSTGLLLTGGIAALVFAYLVRFLAVSLNTVDASLSKIRPSMEDAARSLGEGPTGTVLRVHAPLMFGGLLSAGLLVFVDVMKELPATLVMRPFNFDTLAVQAYNFASDERLAESALPALAIVAVGILPVILLSRAISRARPGSGMPARS